MNGSRIHLKENVELKVQGDPAAVSEALSEKWATLTRTDGSSVYLNTDNVLFVDAIPVRATPDYY